MFNTNQGVSSKRGSTCRIADLMDFFFIAHPESGRKEGEEGKRIMYFNSKNESYEKQTQITGFAEAVVNFTGNFTGDEADREMEFPFRYVNTTKQLHVYVLVESYTFIIGIALNRTLCSMEDYTLHSGSIKSVIITAYSMFRLFFGTFAKLFINGCDLFKERLEYFFSRYLSLLRLYQMPLVDLFHGVDFLPLDSVNYLRVENLIGQLREKFPQIVKVMFLYQERLLSYSVPKRDLPVLFQYLTQNLLSMSLRAELQPEQQSGRVDSPSHHHGKFLTGAADVSAEAMIANAKDFKLPVVYLSSDENSQKLVPYELVVYRALNATMCMFVRRDVESVFLRELDAVLGPELSAIASHIGESYVAPSNGLTGDTDFHFIYFNPASLSLKTSFYEPSGETKRSTSLPAVPASVIKLACDSMDEFLESDDFTEVSVKSQSDWWVVGKRSNERLLLLLIYNPSVATIADIHQHVNFIIKTHFDSIILV